MKRPAKKSAKARKPAARKRARRPSRPAEAQAAAPVPALIPQPHGGALRHGNPGPWGGGRPKNEIREQLRGIAYGKGLDFLADTLDGKVTVRLVGRCAKCGEEGAIDPEWTKDIMGRIAASVDARLKANEQALRFGVGTQSEQVLSEDDIRAWEGHVARYLHDRLTAEGWTVEQVGALLTGLDEHMRAFDPRETRRG